MLPVGSVWIGSTGGSVVNAAPPDNWYGKKDSLTPFAKAFYHRDTDYFVIPLTFIVMGNAVWQVHGYGRSGDDQQFFSSLAS